MFNPKEKMSQKEMVDGISQIHEWARDGEFYSINNILLAIEKDTSKHYITFALRCSSFCKQQLEDYDNALNRAISALEYQGMEPRKILHGLTYKNGDSPFKL